MKTQQQRQEVPTVAHAQATGWSTHSTAQYTAYTESAQCAGKVFGQAAAERMLCCAAAAAAVAK